MRRLVSVQYIEIRANTVFSGVCRGFVYAYTHECRVQWSGEYSIYKRISRFRLHCMRRLTGVEYSGRANTVFPGVCHGFASRAGVSDLIDRHHRCLRRVLLSKNSSSQMRNWVVGIRDSRAVEERSIGFVLEKEPKQSRKVVQLSTLDMGEGEEGSLQQEAAAKTQEIMSPQIAAAAAAA
ncbi:unnamed protein product [Sphagnum troendelagicum]|uniref:Uncharacterized protein n=1 Tax=Sphagnum troendelagicum TaxID=128251 RepID=A0ABP0UAT8_9BRYO